MKNSQRARSIFLSCMLIVGVFSAVIIWKTLRPSPGKPYEKIDVIQALEYMEYEEDYIYCDVGTEEEYTDAHIIGAINIPYEKLTGMMLRMIPDLETQIYIYSRNRKTNDKAATKLCEIGYLNVTEAGVLDDWKKVRPDLIVVDE